MNKINIIKSTGYQDLQSITNLAGVSEPYCEVKLGVINHKHYLVSWRQ